MGANFCPLCSSNLIVDYSRDFLRHYHECQDCHLVFVPRSELISPDEEKTRYDAHENSSEDEGYMTYLQNVYACLRPFLDPAWQGLDFGCGRSKVFYNIAAKENILIDSYDLFYHPLQNIWNKKYDFIILSEVIEHLRDPQDVLKRLRSILKMDGLLFVKTKLLPTSKIEFDNWFYKRDKTHIQFFNISSFEKLSDLFDLQLVQILGPDLFLFRAK